MRSRILGELQPTNRIVNRTGCVSHSLYFFTSFSLSLSLILSLCLCLTLSLSVSVSLSFALSLSLSFPQSYSLTFSLFSYILLLPRSSSFLSFLSISYIALVYSKVHFCTFCTSVDCFYQIQICKPQNPSFTIFCPLSLSFSISLSLCLL